MAMSPTEFARKHRVDPNDTNTGRLVTFLIEGSRACPKRFFSKRIMARIAFNLRRAPNRDSDYMKRISNLLSSASAKMLKDHGQEIWTDPVEGARATVDDADKVETVHRKKRKRVVSYTASLQRTDASINERKLPGKLKQELMKSRTALTKVLQGTRQFPLLPDANGTGNDNSGGNRR